MFKVYNNKVFVYNKFYHELKIYEDNELKKTIKSTVQDIAFVNDKIFICFSGTIHIYDEKTLEFIKEKKISANKIFLISQNRIIINFFSTNRVYDYNLKKIDTFPQGVVRCLLEKDERFYVQFAATFRIFDKNFNLLTIINATYIDDIINFNDDIIIRRNSKIKKLVIDKFETILTPVGIRKLLDGLIISDGKYSIYYYDNDYNLIEKKEIKHNDITLDEYGCVWILDGDKFEMIDMGLPPK